MELSEKAYSKLVLGYIQHHRYEEALAIAQQMRDKFPNSYTSTFILSKAYFWKGDYANAAKYGEESIKLAASNEDKFTASMLTASAYIELSKPESAFTLLSAIPKSNMSSEYLEMKIILDIMMQRDAIPDFKRLHAINARAAEKLLYDLLEIR